jgi:predicted transposase YbfD/YdcC
MNPLEFFNELPDPRNNKNKLYPLETLVFITLSAVIAGSDTFVDIANFGKVKKQWISKFVPLPDGKTPSHDALNDFFRHLNPDKFRDCFVNWTSQICGITEGELIAIDGKRVRGSYDNFTGKSAIHMISAWSSKSQITLAQKKVDDKSNEITAIPSLLEVLELKGALVSIDAMGCQKEIASKIKSCNADYLLGLKGNQATMLDDVQYSFKVLDIESTFTTTEKSHGRLEKRTCDVLTDLQMLEAKLEWEGLKSVVRIKTERTEIINQKKSEETRYYISSQLGNGEYFNHQIRSHWGIENKLHWVLDVNFKEDLSRLRLDHADQNFAIIRHIALNLIKLDDTPKMSQRIKRKAAAWDEDFLEKLMKLKIN